MNIIPFEPAMNAMLDQRVWLTPSGAEAARAYKVMAPIAKLVKVDPDPPPFPIPRPSTPILPPEDNDIDVVPSDDENVVATVAIWVGGRQKTVATVWDDGLVDVFASSFGPEDGGLFIRGVQAAYQLVGGAGCKS